MASTLTNVTCPFCSLHCDDLTVSCDDDALAKVIEHGCEKAKSGFERPLGDSRPCVQGKPTDFDSALTRARQLLKDAKRPLFSGLATDVDCMREVMTVADRVGAAVDHMHTDAMMRNVRNVQSKGWITTTMAEVRNRADFILIVGTSVQADFPRFYERLYCVEETLFGLQSNERECVFLGPNLELPKLPKGYKKPLNLNVAHRDLIDVLAALRALLQRQTLHCDAVSGIKLSTLTGLADKMRQAKYGVIVWDAGKFDFQGGDLVVQLLNDVVRDMNANTRFAGFPLVGNNGGASAQSVCAWQCGYPLRVSFASGQPEYDPLRFSAANLIAAGACDLLLWISTITAGRVPPRFAGPVIALMEPGVHFEQTPDVYIPVGTPGMHHGGRLVRCDNVVSLPLRAPVENDLPTVAGVMKALGQEFN